MKTAKEITSDLGADAIATALGVSVKRVVNCTVQYPAAWFDVVSKMCIDAGVACPRAAFTFRRVGG